MRSSVLVTTDGGTNILIDCGPDFYHQMLRLGSPSIDALLITHSHYDHVGGMDDLRPYCSRGSLPVYCRKDVENDLRERIPYCFYEHLYPGVPTFDIHAIKPAEPITTFDVPILPLPVKHAKLDILGFKIGDKFAYITDCKTMPDETKARLRDIDTLVINALRHEEHLSHLNLQQALEIIDQLNVRQAYLTHFAHQIGLHKDFEHLLPPNVKGAYDGLCIEV